MNKSIFSKPLLSISIIALTAMISCGKDDEPAVAPNTVPVITAQSFNASEDANDTSVFGKVAATDAESDALSFSIKTNSNDLFEITNTGDISLASGKSLDFETAVSHTLSVDVSDGILTSNAAITINVVDVNENVTPQISDQTLTIAENSPLNTLIGTISATDADNDNLTFTSTNLGTNVTLSPQGELSVAEILNFESLQSFIINVTVSDGQLSNTARVMVDITDVNDSPIFSGPTNITVPEDIGDTENVVTLTAADEDGDTLTYSITEDNDNLFRITNVGRVMLLTGKNLDFETSTSHTFKIVAADPDGATGETLVTLNVTDIADTNLVTGGNVTTFVGPNTGFGDNGKLINVAAVTADRNGNVYATNGEDILKITATGEVTTLVSRGTNGIPNNIYFNDIVIDSTGDNLFFVSSGGFNTITNSGYSAVHKYILSTNTLSVFAGGTTSALADNFGKMAIDNSNRLYVISSQRRKIFRISTTGTIQEIVQNSSFGGFFESIAVDSESNVYAGDGNEIYEIVVSGSSAGLTGTRTRFAGKSSGPIVDGPIADARFCEITGLVFDASDNLYVVDGCSHSVRKISTSNQVTTLAGPPPSDFTFGDVNGANGAVRFNLLSDITINRANGELFVSDEINQKIKKIIEVL